jgi:hypothetical protein
VQTPASRGSQHRDSSGRLTGRSTSRQAAGRGVLCVFRLVRKVRTLVAWGLAPKRLGEGICRALQA